MLVKLFQLFFGKFIGLDYISEGKKEKIAKAALYAAKELTEAGIRGATDGKFDEIVAKFKKEF